MFLGHMGKGSFIILEFEKNSSWILCYPGNLQLSQDILFCFFFGLYFYENFIFIGFVFPSQLACLLSARRSAVYCPAT